MSEETTTIPAVIQPKPSGISIGRRGIELRSLEDLTRFATFAFNAGMVPESFHKCKAPISAVVVAIQSGLEVGLTITQALANICVVNGRPCLWGDGPKSLVMASGLVEDLNETWDEATKTATCAIKRKGQPSPIVRSFSMADAKVARLDVKAGPWQQYPYRMCANRARTFALRDGFADCLLGLSVAEEVQDYATPERRVVAADQDPLLAQLSDTTQGAPSGAESK